MGVAQIIAPTTGTIIANATATAAANGGKGVGCGLTNNNAAWNASEVSLWDMGIDDPAITLATIPSIRHFTVSAGSVNNIYLICLGSAGGVSIMRSWISLQFIPD